jgi:hypothetical protein
MSAAAPEKLVEGIVNTQLEHVGFCIRLTVSAKFRISEGDSFSAISIRMSPGRNAEGGFC